MNVKHSVKIGPNGERIYRSETTTVFQEVVLPEEYEAASFDVDSYMAEKGHEMIVQVLYGHARRRLNTIALKLHRNDPSAMDDLLSLAKELGR